MYFSIVGFWYLLIVIFDRKLVCVCFSCKTIKHWTPTKIKMSIFTGNWSLIIWFFLYHSILLFLLNMFSNCQKEGKKTCLVFSWVTSYTNINEQFWFKNTAVTIWFVYVLYIAVWCTLYNMGITLVNDLMLWTYDDGLSNRSMNFLFSYIF